ncbi:ectonucleoside triphosphate diphosphohydrolase 2 [Rhipicephalus sanguineus]|uniref:ectonucleoside triphosphate diphosphohydrolase 2 n=1 Tax=Rhipicephalus sanguineus TaxID=34632 RepID=UPI001893DE1C|nr:ectonucleoside triphosphate diphosphohydrolase 2 [Rhipicephalus sanguineus]
MEVKLKSAAAPDRSPVTVRTHAGATADSLLGAFCHDLGQDYDPRLALYTRSNEPLRGGASLHAMRVQPGDTLFVRHQRSPHLFLANWGLLGVICAVLGLLGLLLVSMAYGLTGGRVPFVHGVVVDAGSSHSQATLYYWEGAKYFGTGRVVQVDFREIDGGISSLGPRKTGPALEHAVNEVRGELDAPVFLGATAGMRVLNLTNPMEADAILMAVECALKPLGLQRATILSGHDEGLFAWLSTNYLFEVIPPKSGNPMTLGALDLGGASTQISFAVDGNRSGNDVSSLQLYGRRYNVFSVSYLCYGVNELHRRYLAKIITEQDYEYSTPMKSPCHNSGFSFNVTAEEVFDNFCTKTSATEQWLKDHPTAVFTFIGDGTSAGCQNFIRQLLDPNECKKNYTSCMEKPSVPVPHDMKFVGVSAYYYTLKALNSTGKSLSAFKNASDWICSVPWNEAVKTGIPKRFLSRYCLQAMYIRDLLLDKYGFSEESWPNLSFEKTANGYELGWSLGFMINATNAIPAAEPSTPSIGLNLFVLLVVLFALLLVLAAVFLLLARKQSRARRNPPS